MKVRLGKCTRQGIHITKSSSSHVHLPRECGFAHSNKPLVRKRLEECGMFQFGGSVRVERFDDEYLTSRFICASRGICQRDYVIFLSHLFLSRHAT